MVTEDNGASRTRQGIQSIEIGAGLLNVLADSATPLALKDLAARAGVSSSKAHKYLVSLVRSGLTRQDPVSGRYDLGTLALKMGIAALNRRDVVRAAIDAAIDINQRHDLTTVVSIWTPRGPTVIGLYNSTEMVVGNVGVGSILPVLRSASGRVFLAYLPREATRGLVEHELSRPLARRGGLSVENEEDVKALIERVWRLRVGWTKDDLVVGLNAIAAPVFDNQGVIAASIAVMDNTEMVDVTSPRSLVDELISVVDQASQRLGFWLNGEGESFAEWVALQHGKQSPNEKGPPPAVRNPTSFDLDSEGMAAQKTSRAHPKK